MSEILTDLRSDLRKISDEKLRESGKRFFKEEVKMYGTKTAEVSKMAKVYFAKLHSLSKSGIYALCEDLWKSGYMEESFIAAGWSYYIRDQYEEKDLDFFEKWIENYVNNWASCDVFCNHTVGTYIVKYPRQVSRLKKWTSSPRRFMKRAAAVSFIIPAKKGLFLQDAFEISDALLTDTDDLVQKGYGWLLKAASQAHQQEVFDYVMKKKAIMRRTALRYAIEKMPSELKKQAMAK